MTVTIITFYWATKAGAFLQILEWGKEHGADRGRGDGCHVGFMIIFWVFFIF